TRRLPNLAREGREGEREAHRWRSLPGALRGRLRALPVRPRRRGSRPRQPVEGDVVEDVVSGEVARGLVVDERARDLVVGVRVVVEQPGRELDGRVEEA